MKYVSQIIAALLVVFHRSIQLAIKPYETMRSVSQRTYRTQVGVIALLVYLYFVYATAIRSRTLDPVILSSSSLWTFAYFVLTFVLVTGYFYVFGYIAQHFKKAKLVEYRTYISLFAYSLVPTILWFFATSTLFVLVPPPRGLTLLGKAFSVIFIVYSITLLLWRFNLLYISLRFALKAKFYTILVAIITFCLWFGPYSVLMYKHGIFRIPFI